MELEVLVMALIYIFCSSATLSVYTDTRNTLLARMHCLTTVDHKPAEGILAAAFVLQALCFDMR
jgi:hypothetical protein